MRNQIIGTFLISLDKDIGSKKTPVHLGSQFGKFGFCAARVLKQRVPISVDLQSRFKKDKRVPVNTVPPFLKGNVLSGIFQLDLT